MIVEAAAAENAEYHCGTLASIPIHGIAPHVTTSSSTWSPTAPTSRRRGSPPTAASCGAPSRSTNGSGASSTRCRWRCRWGIAAWPCAWRWTPTCPARATEIADGTTAAGDLAAVADAFAGRGRFFEAARAAERARRLAARRGALPPRRRADRRGARPRARRRAARGRPASTSAWSRRAAATRPPPRGWRSGGCSTAWAVTRRPPATCRSPRARPRLRTAAPRALCAPAAGARLPRRRRGGRGPAAPGSTRRCRASPEELRRARGRGGGGGRRRRGPAAPSGRRRRRPRSPAASSMRRLLGGGATGRVYEAVDTLLGMPVALKLLQLGGGARRSGAAGLPPLRARGRGGRPAPPPQHRRAVRRAAGVGPVRVRADAGRDAGRAPGRRRPADARRRPPPGARPAGGARRGARARHRPPRRQTRQRLLRRRRQREARRFRRRAPRRLRPDAVGRLPGNAGVHVARADQQRADRRRRRLLCAGRDAVRGARRAGRRSSVPISSASTWARRRRRPRRCARRSAARTTRRCCARSPRRPPIASARRVEMAEAVAAWPLERRRGRRARRHRASQRRRPSRAPVAPPAPPAIDDERELWRTAEADWSVRRDARTARDVLIEERAQPLEDAALDTVAQHRRRRRTVRAARPAAVRRSARDLVRGDHRRGAAARRAARARSAVRSPPRWHRCPRARRASSRARPPVRSY